MIEIYLFKFSYNLKSKVFEAKDEMDNKGGLQKPQTRKNSVSGVPSYFTLGEASFKLLRRHLVIWGVTEFSLDWGGFNPSLIM